MDTEKLIIIGRSEFITPEILAQLATVKGTKVAINHHLDFVDYVAFIDNWMGNIDFMQAIPLTLKCFNIPNSDSYELCQTPTDGKLLYYGFTHDFVISWGLAKGFKRIVLVGTADFLDGGHYNSDDIFAPNKKCIIDSMDYINSLDNVYTLNPKSKLQVKRIKIKEIRNGISKKDIRIRSR